MRIQLLNTSISQKTMPINKEVSIQQGQYRKTISNLNKSLVIDKSINNTTIDRTLPVQPTVKHKSTERRYKHLNYQQIKRQYLTRVLINRAINTRLSIKKMEDIPASLFTEGLNLDIAQNLIMNSKISLQTSLLRTLLYSYKGSQQEESKLKLYRGHNTFVIGASIKQSGQHKKAILLLSQLVKYHIRFVVQKFATNRHHTKALINYFNTMSKNYEYCRQSAMLSIKMLPERNKGQVNEQNLILSRMATLAERVQGKSSRLLLAAFNSIKIDSLQVGLLQKNAAKMMVTFSKLRRQKAFLIWQHEAESSRVRKFKAKEFDEEKLFALRRIVRRNYLKLFVEICERISIYERVAIRLACASHLNPQKALWRLLVNAKNSS